MERGGCVDGQLDTALYNSPIPFVGLYIAVASMVCFFCMNFELMYGMLIRRKPFMPLKLFPLNAFTLTVLGIATKIPNDLVTPMPTVDDQLSKLTGIGLVCLSLGFYMPSLGAMGTLECYGNLAALSLMAITMVVNVCIQIHTGVIFVFITEHIIVMVCMVVSLLVVWSSPIALTEQKKYERSLDRFLLTDVIDKGKDFDGLRSLISAAYGSSYKCDGQTLLSKSPNQHTVGLVCSVSTVVVFQSFIKSFFPTAGRIKSCSGVSDYKWSIPIVTWIQILTLIVAFLPFLYRWFNLLHRSNKFSLEILVQQLDFEYLKWNNLPLRVLNKYLPNVLVVAKDYAMDGLLRTQIILYKGSIFFVGFPVLFYQKVTGFGTSSTEGDPIGEWTCNSLRREMKADSESFKRDCPRSHLIALISECRPGISLPDCADFIQQFEATGKEMDKIFFQCNDYRVSCVTMLVFSGILAELMPPSSSRRKSITESLKDSFEIIHFVDRKTHAPDRNNKRRWASSEEVWKHWGNPSHWFQTKFISKFNFKQVDHLGDLTKTLHAAETYFKEAYGDVYLNLANGDPLTTRHMTMVLIEFAIICKFIREQRFESTKDLLNCLEMCFRRMLYFTLSGLPMAILQEMDGEDLYEIGEGRIKKAFNFFCELDLLKDIMEFSWPKIDGHRDAFSAAASFSADDDDAIREIGSDANV